MVHSHSDWRQIDSIAGRAADAAASNPTDVLERHLKARLTGPDQLYEPDRLYVLIAKQPRKALALRPPLRRRPKNAHNRPLSTLPSPSRLGMNATKPGRRWGMASTLRNGESRRD